MSAPAKRFEISVTLDELRAVLIALELVRLRGLMNTPKRQADAHAVERQVASTYRTAMGS